MDHPPADEPAGRTEPRTHPVHSLVRHPGRAVLAVSAPAAHLCPQGVRYRQSGAGHVAIGAGHVLEHRHRRPPAPHVAAGTRDHGVVRRVPGRDDARNGGALALAARARGRRAPCRAGRGRGGAMKTLLILGFLGLIVYNLGAGLYYMLVDTGRSKRTVNALTRRIVLSIVLVGLVAAGIFTGVIDAHGV